ncbi:hypothetical protein [Granulicella tundricola]|uniref:Uncharacterized protein n=1 Tax=Granulicella tundricola (strain ATCC BAA-1859 / DSM 23138 / MP5ACTX9) TaxID=1198114 RepID=E8X2Q2_GRATM|nr:hypothetical protein [Granulicella tundricola]ADW70349.1 hypothetical protein AciX9_3341 [Granulicella tundricola MP5ACTX9]
MPSLQPPPAAYYDTCERTSRFISSAESNYEVDPAWQGVETSRVLKQKIDVSHLQVDIANMAKLTNDWNGYDSPRPTTASLRAAMSVLDRFASLTIIPEKVTASADGGVALIFVGVEKQRAVIEVFGTEQDYVLLYDTDGNSFDIAWPIEVDSQNAVLSKLQSYLRGSQVAPVG